MHVTTTAEVLNQMFRPVYAISSSCVVVFDNEGVRIPGADPTYLSIVDIEVPSKVFDSYSGEGIKLGLDLNRLMEILEMTDGESHSRLSLDEDNQLLNLQVENKEFVLGLVNLDAVPKQTDIPEIRYPVNFEIPQTTLADTIRTASVFSEKVTFEVEDGEKSIIARAEGDIDWTRVNLSKDPDVSVSRTADVTCSFSIDSLKNIVSVIPESTDILIELAHDRPIILNYSMIESASTVEFTFAPWHDAS